MPQQTSPPYYPASTTIPRQLVRWDDVNAQNGPLKRASLYLPLPIFAPVTPNWVGVPDITVAFNFECQNNFTLAVGSLVIGALNTYLAGLTIVSPNYIACLMWKDQKGNVHRYQLWSGVGEVVPLSFPLYNGQIIKKNFRIEIWSIGAGNVSESVGQLLTTSVLQGIDYRYASDAPLSSNDGEVTNFAAISAYNPLAAPTTNLRSRFKASSGVSGTTWTALVGGPLWLGGNVGNITTATDATISNQKVITNTNTLNVAPCTPTALAVVYLVVKFNAGDTGSVFGISNDITILGNTNVGLLSKANLALSIDGNGIGNIVVGQWCLVCAIFNPTSNTSGGYVIPISGNMSEPVFGTPHDGTVAGSIGITIGTNTIGQTIPSMYLAEVLVYDTQVLGPLRSSIITYVQSVYGPASFTLPLTFPANSTPQPNTI